MKGLLVDFGGVLTTNVFDSFKAFCVEEGLPPNTMKDLLRDDPRASALIRAIEKAEIDEERFGNEFAPLLGLEPSPGMLHRIFGGIGPDPAMVEAVKAARRQGVKTGLISNSMGYSMYDRSTFPELFDAVVLSGEEGVHKPQPEAFQLAAERVGLEPDECVFVDDLRENCAGAEAVGLTAILHRGAECTLPQLEELLGLELR
jgi:putative hydrolase of the HAD superfamily